MCPKHTKPLLFTKRIERREHFTVKKIADSVSVGMTPHFTFLENLTVAYWNNAHESVGSDHYIVSINLKAGSSKPRGKRIITKWDVFWPLQQAELWTGDDEMEIADIDEWPAFHKHYERPTETVLEESQAPHCADARLLHMWDARMETFVKAQI